MYTYYQNINIKYIKECFQEHLKFNNLSLQVLSSREILFNFIKCDDFKKLYFKLALDIIDFLNINNSNICLQQTPTPRIFNPGDHGTSFHCDYWYGHGERSRTIWIPLSTLIEGNSFLICKQEMQEYIFEKMNSSKGVNLNELEIISHSDWVITDNESTCIIFDSKHIHGSPINSSALQRVSFDFRISESDDLSSTKDMDNYYYLINNSFQLKPNKFEKLKFLKYICGGNGKNTLNQHVLIEEISKLYSINIVAQEAELERFGHPMLFEYINKLSNIKNIDGIVISSKFILSQFELDYIYNNNNKNKLYFYFALENILIHPNF